MTVKLLPIGTRVKHFNGDPRYSHGHGSIVAYNQVKRNDYIQNHFKDAAEMSVKAGLSGAFIDSLYSNERCPYVVQWDVNPYKPEYPIGYKDVYEPDSISVVTDNDVETKRIILELFPPEPDNRIEKPSEDAVFIHAYLEVESFVGKILIPADTFEYFLNTEGIFEAKDSEALMLSQVIEKHERFLHREVRTNPVTYNAIRNFTPRHFKVNGFLLSAEYKGVKRFY
jgi:hypothetical protein